MCRNPAGKSWLCRPARTMLQRTKPLLGSVRVSETPDNPRGPTLARTDAVRMHKYTGSSVPPAARV